MKLNFVDKLKHFTLYMMDYRYEHEDDQDQEDEEATLRVDRGPSNDRAEKERGFSFLVSRKKQSLRDSQGVGKFIGSSYNGPGNIDHNKVRSNKPRGKKY